MFTGIVQPGVLSSARRRKEVLGLRVGSRPVARELRVGDSVAVNGVCLTAREVGRRTFSVDVTNETVTRSTLGGLRPGQAVNLELPLRVSDRLGGHIVQGHVDGTATMARITSDGASRRMWFEVDPALRRYLIPKGSVAVDGVSLTVVSAEKSSFEVMLIPHTLEETTLGHLQSGDSVNVEVDMMAKYAERLMSAQTEKDSSGAI
ncbi:MAG: riboflavin synthase [Actinomycetota bacterium]|nr:riboflavin synthase [Actinomycetota bacterium]